VYGGVISGYLEYTNQEGSNANFDTISKSLLSMFQVCVCAHGCVWVCGVECVCDRVCAAVRLVVSVRVCACECACACVSVIKLMYAHGTHLH
jgi:hypothetical protein